MHDVLCIVYGVLGMMCYVLCVMCYELRIHVLCITTIIVTIIIAIIVVVIIGGRHVLNPRKRDAGRLLLPRGCQARLLRGGPQRQKQPRQNTSEGCMWDSCRCFA